MVRAILNGLHENMIDVEIIAGANAGQRVFLRSSFNKRDYFAVYFKSSSNKACLLYDNQQKSGTDL
jgi:hypothetical protein